MRARDPLLLESRGWLGEDDDDDDEGAAISSLESCVSQTNAMYRAIDSSSLVCVSLD